jgi:hypothetical protein
VSLSLGKEGTMPAALDRIRLEEVIDGYFGDVSGFHEWMRITLM